jgi:hypothetical protein
MQVFNTDRLNLSPILQKYLPEISKGYQPRLPEPESARGCTPYKAQPIVVSGKDFAQPEIDQLRSIGKKVNYDKKT